VAAAMGDQLAAQLIASGHRLASIPLIDPGRADDGWDKRPAAPEIQLADARMTREILADWRPDVVVVDHYRLNEPWEAAISDWCPRLAVIDDLANRRHRCGLLIDQTYARRERDYVALVPEQCTIMLGADFAMLRPEFAALRNSSLARRAEPRSVRSILVSLGSTDLGGVTAVAVRAVLAAETGARVVVVASRDAPSAVEISALAHGNPLVEPVWGTSDMAGLLAEADLAIGAAGVSAWERCCLGVPSVMVALADNQRQIARVLDRAGAACQVDGPEAITAATRRLAGDAALRGRISAAAAAIVDGLGVERIVARLEEWSDG